MLLTTGMLLVVTPLLLDRHFMIADFWKGTLTGIGLMLEVMALDKIQKHKKGMSVN